MFGGSTADWNFRGRHFEGLVRCAAELPDAFLYTPAQGRQQDIANGIWRELNRVQGEARAGWVPCRGGWRHLGG